MTRSRSQKAEQKAQACGSRLGGIGLADTMGWANPLQIKRLVGTVRERWPNTPIKLHLHDTRALAIANVVAALAMGIDCYDSAVAGMGGCPFAAHRGQRHDRGRRVPLSGDGRRDRHRSRCDDRGRLARRACGGSPAARQAEVRRQSRDVSGAGASAVINLRGSRPFGARPVERRAIPATEI